DPWGGQGGARRRPGTCGIWISRHVWAEPRAVPAGPGRGAGAPLAAPLLAASTYVSQGEPDPERGYGRNGNPGWTVIEEALAAIEGPGTAAGTFASGQAASMALMLALAPGRRRSGVPADGCNNT